MLFSGPGDISHRVAFDKRVRESEKEFGGKDFQREGTECRETSVGAAQ